MTLAAAPSSSPAPAPAPRPTDFAGIVALLEAAMTAQRLTAPRPPAFWGEALSRADDDDAPRSLKAARLVDIIAIARAAKPAPLTVLATASPAQRAALLDAMVGGPLVAVRGRFIGLALVHKPRCVVALLDDDMVRLCDRPRPHATITDRGRWYATQCLGLVADALMQQEIATW